MLIGQWMIELCCAAHIGYIVVNNIHNNAEAESGGAMGCRTLFSPVLNDIATNC